MHAYPVFTRFEGRLDDTYIEKAWKHVEMEEIEDLAAELLGKAQEAQSIEDDLFCILYLAFRCGFKKGYRVATG